MDLRSSDNPLQHAFREKAFKHQYQAIGLHNYRQVPQIAQLPEEKLFEIEVVAQVLPFRSNRYVIENLINWENPWEDPMFILNFPQRKMLSEEHFQEIADLLKGKASAEELNSTTRQIQAALNPNPDGQMENAPLWKRRRLSGVQHKYKNTVLYFPEHGQQCHTWCSFCFRWSQFVKNDELKFSSGEVESLIEYLAAHPDVSDLLITGGDPFFMSAKRLASYIEPILRANLPGLTTIRIGTKAVTSWPGRFVFDQDSDDILRLIEKMVKSGKVVAIMAHVNHPVELSTEVVHRAISRLLSAGAQIRTQSPVLAHINDNPVSWVELWRKQLRLSCVPYYFFVPRDTGARPYFELPIARALEIFQQAYSVSSGLVKTVRGPIMSVFPGKVRIINRAKIGEEFAFVLEFLQCRNPDWLSHIFFAKYDDRATRFSQLQPFSSADAPYFRK